MNRRPPIAVYHLTRYFGRFCAVDHVTFEIQSGEILALLGPNGAGKTTTLKMLCGLLLPSEGEAWVAGLDVRTQSQVLKRKIGYMSQLFSLYEDLTVIENIRFFGDLYGVPRVRQDEVLQKTGLLSVRDSLVRSLPSGLRQTLALWVALMHDPEVLFLDEPTAGADPQQRAEFWNTIRSLRLPSIVTTHYMTEAENADRVALMNRGRLITLDTPEGLKRHYTASWNLFALKAPLPSDIRDTLMKIPGVLGVISFGRDLHVRTERALRIEDLRQALVGQGLPQLQITPIAPTLEHVFFAWVEPEGVFTDAEEHI